MNVAEYDARFTDLAHCAPQLVPTNKEKVIRFVDELRYHIRVTLVGESRNSLYLDIIDNELRLCRLMCMLSETRKGLVIWPLLAVSYLGSRTRGSSRSHHL